MREPVRKLWRFAPALLCLSLGMPAMSAPKAAATPAGAVVTLDVYSGRPNPSWPLSEALTAELRRRLDGMPASKPAGSEFDGLGYRAVSAELPASAGAAVVTAARGVVTYEGGGERRAYADPGRQFELWLVRTGADHLPPDLLQYVEREVAKPQP